MTASLIIQEISVLADPTKAQILSRFFKTGPGEYGEGDRFLGVTVPLIRSTIKRYEKNLSLQGIEQLLYSPFHEIRLAGVCSLVRKSQKANHEEQTILFSFYLKHLKQINNWDLVDLSAPHIMGVYLFDKERSILWDLAGSSVIWERRIAIIATLFFIKRGDYETTISLLGILLHDQEDLIRKANGWMLREIEKRGGRKVFREFLTKNIRTIPRTTLRYAIERLDEKEKRYWMEYGKK